jgi:hypothetical protein
MAFGVTAQVAQTQKKWPSTTSLLKVCGQVIGSRAGGYGTHVPVLGSIFQVFVMLGEVFQVSGAETWGKHSIYSYL